MKKALKVILKFVLFFVGFICLSLIDISFKNPNIWRFFAELIPCLAVIILSIVFYFIGEKKIKIVEFKNPIKNILLGIGISIVWFGIPLLILFVADKLNIISVNNVSFLWLWFISCLLNTIMQELLIRGYLYQLLKKEYDVIVAIIFTTILFTLLHGGALELGIIPVLNVLTTSLLFSELLEYSGTIILPIVVHFAWNFVGAIVFGVVSLADDYPNVLNTTIDGNTLISGGSCKLEGSVLVLIINIILILVFTKLIKRKQLSSN